VSPLISAFECTGTERSWCPAIDTFPLEIAPVPALDERLRALAHTCEQTQQPEPVRAALDGLSWALFDAAMAVVPHQVLARAARRCDRRRGGLDAVHARMLATIGQYAARVNSVPAARNQPIGGELPTEVIVSQ
jgi:hypothetical protein